MLDPAFREGVCRRLQDAGAMSRSVHSSLAQRWGPLGAVAGGAGQIGGSEPGPYGADDRAAKRLRRETGGSAVRRRPKKATGPGPTPLRRSRTTGRAPRYLARAADRGRDDARRGDAGAAFGTRCFAASRRAATVSASLLRRRCRMIPEPGGPPRRTIRSRSAARCRSVTR